MISLYYTPLNTDWPMGIHICLGTIVHVVWERWNLWMMRRVVQALQ
jgi:hypothetical protein